MSITKPILFIILVAVLVGLGAFLGYRVGLEEGKGLESSKLDEILEKYIILPRSELFGPWQNTVTGTVTEFTPQSITIERSSVSFSVSLTGNTRILRRSLDESGIPLDSGDNLSLSDVEIGNSVAVVISANDKGDLTAERIFILPQEVFGPSQGTQPEN